MRLRLRRYGFAIKIQDGQTETHFVIISHSTDCLIKIRYFCLFSAWTNDTAGFKEEIADFSGCKKQRWHMKSKYTWLQKFKIKDNISTDRTFVEGLQKSSCRML
jgi:hypothetical protein